MKFIFTIAIWIIGFNVIAQFTLEPMVKVGFYGSMKRDQWVNEYNVDPNIYWKHGFSLHIPEWHIAFDVTWRTQKQPFKNPFLKPTEKPVWRGQFDPNYKIGDTLGRLGLGYNNWAYFSINMLPTKWHKHKLMIGLGPIEREGGVAVLAGYVVGSWKEPIFSGWTLNQKAVVYKAEYIFKPFKYTLLSINFDYARFDLAPKDFYGLTVSLGSYFDYKLIKK
jgi:hypothetical protein